MNSSVTKEFRKQLDALPVEVQEQADRAYTLWRSDPYHPSLQFKQVSRGQAIYSVRVGLGYRALGLREEITSTGSGSAHMPSMMTSSSGYSGRYSGPGSAPIG